MSLIKRLFHSAFTKLLFIILAAGFAITLAVVVGFSLIRFHSITHLDRNLALYAQYLKQDLGSPPDYRRAEQIARHTGMAVRFDHPDGGWQTPGFPTRFSFRRAWTREVSTGLWTGRSRGNVFVRTRHAGGNLIFVSPHEAVEHENAGIFLLGMATMLCAILAAAYYFIRRVLYPLRPLKAGVEALGSGRLDHRIPISGRDEFRDLGEAFNAMAGRLSDLLKSKEQLLLDVSHELRSPLTRLKVQVEMIQDDEIRQGMQADLAEMEAMISTILEEARLRNTAAALNLERVDMMDLLPSVVAEFQHHPVGVACRHLKAVPVYGDREKLRTLFRNIIENGVKNTPEGGPPVVVSMAGNHPDVEIIVEDRGVGIDETAIPYLFEPFYRTDASRSRKTGGYGLGLSICKAIVDAHKGQIHIAGKPGRGTRVTVLLPVLKNGS